LNGYYKKFARNAFFGGAGSPTIQSLWLALWLSLLCASWQTFSLVRERRTSQKNASRTAKKANAQSG